MNRLYGLAFGLMAGALWINVVWNWDTTQGWEAQAPVGVALVLFWRMGAPWRFKHDGPVPWARLVAGLAIYSIGLAQAWTAVAVVGWNLALWTWLGARLETRTQRQAWSLALLPLLAWPWLKMDCHFLEVGLRHLEAFALQAVLVTMGVTVTRIGTTICTFRASLDIIDECAGLNMLHCLLILGTVLAWYQRRFVPMWETVAKVAALAVLANVLRIITLGVLGVCQVPGWAGIPLHNFTGVVALLVLCAVALSAPTRAPVLRRYVPAGPACEP
ncbi:MAG TPA: archaeosortase/exosortase family protein [Candidatus Xenobia bacterium]|jgi:exosortase/archaeosortase family protein